MEGIVVLILLLLVAWLVLPFILLSRTGALDRRISALERRVAAMQRHHPEVAPAAEPVPYAPPPAPAWDGSLPSQAAPPREATAPAMAAEAYEPRPPSAPQPRTLSPEPSPVPEALGPRFGISPSIDWEQFLGVKLFAWIASDTMAARKGRLYPSQRTAARDDPTWP